MYLVVDLDVVVAFPPQCQTSLRLFLYFDVDDKMDKVKITTGTSSQIQIKYCLPCSEVWNLPILARRGPSQDIGEYCLRTYEANRYCSTNVQYCIRSDDCKYATGHRLPGLSTLVTDLNEVGLRTNNKIAINQLIIAARQCSSRQVPDHKVRLA